MCNEHTLIGPLRIIFFPTSDNSLEAFKLSLKRTSPSSNASITGIRTLHRSRCCEDMFAFHRSYLKIQDMQGMYKGWGNMSLTTYRTRCLDDLSSYLLH